MIAGKTEFELDFEKAFNSLVLLVTNRACAKEGLDLGRDLLSGKVG